jgi:acetyltransferase
VSLAKPIIVLKVGRSAAAAKAAASHTGSLVGDDEVLDAAFRRVGVLRVETVAELFAMAEVLSKQSAPTGPRLAIITNAGGPGGLATDALIRGGGELAPLTPASITALDAFLPSHWSHGNPIDLLGDASPERYGRALEIAAADPNTDGALVILTPQAMTDATATAERVAALAPGLRKPLLTSWMGGETVGAGEELLNRAGISTFRDPDTAAQVFANMWRRSYHLRSIYETPTLAPESQEDRVHRARADRVIATARKAGRTLLTEPEAMRVLAAYGIPTAAPIVARTEGEALAAGEHLGYPVVAKVYSHTITHKAAVGGVRLGLRTASEVRRAYRAIEESVTQAVGVDAFQGVTLERMVTREGYEVILGSSTDPQFGPVLLFGAGGRLVEVMRDRSLGLPPLNGTLARRLMEQTRIYAALCGKFHGEPIDCAALEQLLVRFSHLVAQEPRIKEIDVNPLHVSPEGFVALDARIILHEPALDDSRLPKLAIRPYPVQYITHCQLRTGREVTLRPIRPEDEPRMVTFHEHLSDRSVHYRYFSQMSLQQRTAHERLARMCFNDYDRELAFVAEYRRHGSHDSEIVGVGRLSKLHGRNEAEFAIVIADEWQGQGLGTKLLSLLVETGRTEKLTRIIGHILPDNTEMQHLCRKVGFTLAFDAAAQEMDAQIEL